jgi:hypothetical protein
MKCNDFERHIVDYVDGRTSKQIQQEMDEHIEKCAECRNALIQERAIRERLRKLPGMECPKRVEEKIFASIKNEPDSFISMFKQQILARPGLRFRFVAFVSVAIFIIVFGVLHDDQESSRQKMEFTAEEIEMATQDVELALSYVGFYAKKTEAVLVDRIASEPIVKPIKSTIKKAFQPLLNGDKS